MIIGQQKGKNTKTRQYRNFGMANPEGYRKSLRLMKMAEKFEKPIITTDSPGCKEIVKNKVNGILVPPGDSSAVESAMKYLLNNRHIWK